MNNEENEVPGEYKSMWICIPVFILVFGGLFLVLWAVTKAAGI